VILNGFLTPEDLLCPVTRLPRQKMHTGRMSGTSIERLREFLAQLPPQSQALLMREFERAIERGEDTSVATFVLEQLRNVARGAAEDDPASPAAPVRSEAPLRSEDPVQLMFRPLEPFLVDGSLPVRPGQIRRASLVPVWQWVKREGAPEQARELEAVLAGESGATSSVAAALRKLQVAAAEALVKVAKPGPGGGDLARIVPPNVTEDVLAIGSVLQAREAFETLNSRIPSSLRVFGEPQVASIGDALNLPSLQTPQLLPFALSLVMQRMTAPWQIIRLAITMAGSDDEIRVAATPYGVAVGIALHDLSLLAAGMRADIRRGHFENCSEQLKALHDGVRGLRTELDIRNDSVWGKQLTSIRADISNTLQSEIDSVPGRVRRLLRQRADKDIAANARIDSTDIDETAALIDFVAVCRTFASELAINEVTLRTYSDLQQYVEKATEALVQSLRAGDAKARAYRQMQVNAAIRFCKVLFGAEYASLMTKAAEHAVTGDRQVSRAERK
jgi:hypothetical protein